MLITALYCAASICIFAAMHSTRLSIGGRESKMHAWFTVLCALAAWYCIATAHYYSANSISEAAIALRSQSAAGLLYILSLVWFTSGLLRISRARIGLIAFSAIVIYSVISTATLPFSGRFADLNEVRVLQMPWQETVNIYRGPPRDSRPFALLITLIAFGWCVYCTLRLAKVKNTLPLIALLGYLLMQIGAAIWGYNVDLGNINFVYVSWIPLLWFVAIMSIYFASRQVQLSRRLATEVSALEAAKNELREQAYLDGLTGLPNHQRFSEALAERIQCRKNDTHYLILIEIRDFKSVNMKFGTEAGDRLLIEVASRMCSVQDENSFIARLQGDRFAVIVSHKSRTTAAPREFLEKANNDNTFLSKPYAIGTHRINLAFAMGVVAVQHKAASADNAMLMANLALKEAIAQNKAYVFYDEKLAKSIERSRQLEAELILALNRQMLTLAYQPKIAADGGLLGAEVLSRWHHPELGHISPAEFIPIAERLGLIGDLCTAQVHQVCQQLSRWRRSGFTFKGRMALNISAYQIQSKGFADEFLAVLKTHGESPEHFTAEITESLLLGDVDAATQQLQLLRDAGITIAIDDFGTGHSSLSRLGMLPVDMLKIDLSFVRAMHDPRQLRLIEAIIEMGKAFELQILAEGVENPEQLEKLTNLGCEAFQGYLWSPPLSANDFKQWAIDAEEAATTVAGNSH